MSGKHMDTNKDNVAVSALYTAGTWQWAGLSAADVVTPEDAGPVFRVVNAYMRLYRWLNPRTFSLRHQLLHRHAAIDRLLTDSGCSRVIEVASGFSPRGVSFSADPACEYTEIDLPDMVAAKRRQLEASEAGRSALQRGNFSLRAGDITRLDFVAEFAGADSEGRADSQPTAVISEGLMMYFKREQQLAIWRSIAALVAATGGVYLFDYIPLSEEPPRSWLGRILHFLRVRVLGIQGDFAYDQRDRDAVAADLRASGFTRVESFSTGDVAADWGLPQAGVATHTLIYCCRGPVATASKEPT